MVPAKTLRPSSCNRHSFTVRLRMVSLLGVGVGRTATFGFQIAARALTRLRSRRLPASGGRGQGRRQGVPQDKVRIRFAELHGKVESRDKGARMWLRG